MSETLRSPELNPVPSIRKGIRSLSWEGHISRPHFCIGGMDGLWRPHLGNRKKQETCLFLFVGVGGSHQAVFGAAFHSEILLETKLVLQPSA